MAMATMSTSDVLAVVAATVVALFVAVLATLLVGVARTLRELRSTVTALQEDALVLLDEARGLSATRPPRSTGSSAFSRRPSDSAKRSGRSQRQS